MTKFLQTSKSRTPADLILLPTTLSWSSKTRVPAPPPTNAMSSWMQLCTRSQTWKELWTDHGIKTLHRQLVEKRITQSMNPHKRLVSSHIAHIKNTSSQGSFCGHRLWCRSRLYNDEVVNRRWKSIAFCYDLWLKRSRGLPLSLEVWCGAARITQTPDYEASYSLTSIKSRLSIRFSHGLTNMNLCSKTSQHFRLTV
ncbi:hypothetical protein EDB19DRAFT_1708502, partial [Suillus lakei]